MKNPSAIIAVPLGILSLVGAVAWGAVVAITAPLAGLGDGAASVPSESHLVLGYWGSVYLFLVSLSCLPFMRGKLLIAMGVAAYLTLGAFAIYLLGDSGVGGLALLAPFAAFGAAWVALYKRRLAKQAARI